MTAPGPKRCGRGGCSGLPRLSTAPTVGPCGAEATAGVRRQRSAAQRLSWGGGSPPARLAGPRSGGVRTGRYMALARRARRGHTPRGERQIASARTGARRHEPETRAPLLAPCANPRPACDGAPRPGQRARGAAAAARQQELPVVLRHSAVWLPRRVCQVRNARLLRLQGRAPGAAPRGAARGAAGEHERAGSPSRLELSAVAPAVRSRAVPPAHAPRRSPQAYSHRCKSLGMSTFEAVEIDALSRAGNEAAAKTWLGRLTREQICAMAPAKTAPAKARGAPHAHARRCAATWRGVCRVARSG